MKRYFLFIFTSIFIFHFINAQENEGSSLNLPTFYKNKIHFGFTIAFNSTDFRIHPIKNSMLSDTLIDSVRYNMKTIYTQSAPGFALGIVSDIRIHDYVRIRFTPNISFASRSIQYTLTNQKGDSSKIFQKSVESTFLYFPLEVKIQSKRAYNFSAYIIGGGGYALDLAGSKKNTITTSGGGNQLDNQTVKILRDDYFYSAGGGTDFYLKYFKFGLELKLIIGTKNLLYNNGNIFSRSIEKVNSRMVVFTLTFEG